MKFIRIVAMLVLACAAASAFPLTSSAPSFKETFDGGADSFDLNLQSLTLMPYETTPGSGTYRCRYSVRPIRGLPVDMAGAAVIAPTTLATSNDYTPVPGLPVIYGIALSKLQVFRSGKVVLQNSDSSPRLTLNVLNSIAYDSSEGILYSEIRYLTTEDGRLAIQFDYFLNPGYDPDGVHPTARPLVREAFQVEIFPNGMIRYSYFTVDVTLGEVGLIASGSPTPGADLNYSNSILKASDVVVSESDGSATIAVEVPATEAASFDFTTATGSAVTPSDFTATTGTTSIAIGAVTANVSVPIINDGLGESPENFDVVVRDPVNPDWIFAESRIWILDDDAAGADSGPRMHLAGNRVIVLPPDPSEATITGFRLLSLSSGTLQNPLDLSPVAPNSTFSLQAGAAGLIASGLGIQLTVEGIHSSGTSVPIGLDLDGSNPSPVFNFTTDRIEATEGGFASLVVSASQVGASVSYQIIPLSAQASADYAMLVKTLEFKNGLGLIDIPVLADGVTEGNEEFMVRLINPSSGSFIGPTSRARVLIKDGSGGIRSPTQQLLPTRRLTGRSVNGNLANATWRFVGEPGWRPAGSHGWNPSEGLHQVEYRNNAAPWKLYMAPESYLNQELYSSSLWDLDVAYSNFSLEHPPGNSLTGSLKVNLLPTGMSAFQWRRKGEVTWRNSGDVEELVPTGSHLIEFIDGIPDYHAPSIRSVLVQSGQTTSITAKYQFRPTSGVAPVGVTEPDYRTATLSWVHIPIPVQSTDFKVSFEYRPNWTSSNFRGLIGLSAGTVNAESNLVAALQTDNTSSTLDAPLIMAFAALDGASYVETASLVPVPSGWHFVEFEVRPTLGTYNLHVTPPTGPKVTIRNSASLRTGNSTPELGYLSINSQSSLLNSQNVRGICVEKTPPTSNWRFLDFPDQTESFDLAVELQILPNSPAPNELPILFGLSDGIAASPSSMTGNTNFSLPTFLGASGRYAPLIAQIHVDLAARTYEIRGGKAGPSSGLLSRMLTKANRFYVYTPTSSIEGIRDYKVADAVLPPAYSPPTGNVSSANMSWVHLPIKPQTGRFSMTCDIRARSQPIGSSYNIDSFVGFSSSRVGLSNQVAVVLRALLPISGGGSWDAHSGGLADGGFMREVDGDVPIVDGKLYHATFHIDVPTKIYRISNAPDDGGPVVVLKQGTFRDPATELRYITLRSLEGRLEVSNIRGPLPHPLDSPAFFTGQIETPNGFGTGTVVADHVVMTSARLVIDPSTGNFFTRGITWRRSGGGYPAIPDACEPSHILLPASYSAALLGTPAGDSQDVALLAFRPLDVPESDNAPGGGCFSGFQIDDGSGDWTTATVKSFPSFPVSGIAAGNLGKVHTTNLSAVSFLGAGVLKTATGLPGLLTPPGSEGAAVFVEGEDKILRPAAVCIGAADGTPRFRIIDAGIADAIYQANSYQRQPDFLQGLIKGGVYYINQTVEKSTEANRVQILSHLLPSTATWTVTRKYGTTHGPFPGGLKFVASAGYYTIKFGTAPPGFTGPTLPEGSKSLSLGDIWTLPAVYTAEPPASYESWVDSHYDEFEATSAVADPDAQTPWLGVDNLTAYAFGFDPNLGPTRFADPSTWTPGYPLVSIDKAGATPTITVDLLQRLDGKLNYELQYSDELTDWVTHGTLNEIIPAQTNGIWQRVRWTLNSLPGQPGRKFVRTRVTLTE